MNSAKSTQISQKEGAINNVQSFIVNMIFFFVSIEPKARGNKVGLENYQMNFYLDNHTSQLYKNCQTSQRNLLK